MNPVHFHLLVKHFPVIGTVFGIIVLLAGFLLKKDDLKTAAYGLFIITALIAIPAYLSGEPAEEAVENILPGTTEVFIEEHEEIASIAIWLIEALGALALVTLMFAIKGKATHKTLSIVTLLFSLIVFGVMAKVNNTGGAIRHTEIRKASATVLPGAAGETKSDEEENGD